MHMQILNRTLLTITTIFFLIFAITFPYHAEAGSFIAYSMKEAQKRFEATSSVNNEVKELGGITDLAGMVYDDKNRDLIIVGQANKGKPKINLDDFVVAMRSEFVYQKTPTVSIDKTSETDKDLKQVVHYMGGIENTQIGKDMLESDIVLKNLALGKLPAKVWGVQSYFSMMAEQAQKGKEEGRIGSRFWFKNHRPSLAVREGVFAIMELDVGIETEVLYAEINGTPVQDLSSIRDEIGDMFARQVAMNLLDLSVEYPVLLHAKPILAMVSLAEGMKNLQVDSQLSFWLHNYKVPYVETLKYYDVIEARQEIEGRDMLLRVKGGIELNPIVVKLKKGHVTALKDAVLNSRPSGNVLIWNPPLEGWHIPGTEDIEIDQSLDSSSAEGKGFSLDGLLTRTSKITSTTNEKPYSYQLSPPRAEIPKFDIHSSLPSQKYSPNVGGVMLQGAATISGTKEAKVDLASGNFSLIVDGQNARIAPEAYRKFITALWSVYYSNQDPGISIDPTAPGVDKHMVRYIGKVINTDLGRVMRDADYLMKKWAVGTETPNIQGFMNPDRISGKRGFAYVGAWSRFWFVPQDMKFKRGGNMLLFDGGRMTVKTEYMLNDENMRADPSNERFAEFFTAQYRKIAEQYPVYGELFEYAKMVSLAKYLKEQGIPLFWFLMANRDLVLTEDSPGTVDAIVKQSDHFRGVQIEGGVDLGFDVARQGNYVFDREAVYALNEALSKLPANTNIATTLSTGTDIGKLPPEPFSFDLGEQSFTVLPQHSLTSGKDRRGIRYQTDLALRGTGLQLNEQSLNMIDYELFRRGMARELNPILQSMDKQTLEVRFEAIYKEKSEKVTKEKDQVLEKLRTLKNRDFKAEDEFTGALEKVLGKEEASLLRPLIVKNAFYRTNLEVVRYYKPGQQDTGEFGKGWRLLIPYRIKPAESGKREFLNVIIPEKMAVENLLTGEEDVLTFSTDRYSLAGYVPDKLASSQVVGLFLLSDASYRLADKLGNEFSFDQAGYLTDMAFSEEDRFHFEYLDKCTDAFEKTPYQIQPADKEQMEFMGVSIPKRMRVKDLLYGGSEVLTFSDKGQYAGYVPADAGRSRFEVLALMSNASFRLLDKKGNETAFGSSENFTGKFEGVAVSPKKRLVSAVSQGKKKVAFKYTMDKSGDVIITSASLLQDEEGAKPTYVVRYQYDDEGRLCSVKGSDRQTAKVRVEQANQILMAASKVSVD